MRYTRLNNYFALNNMKLIFTLIILSASIITVFSQNNGELKTEQIASKGDSLSHYGLSIIPTPQQVFIDARQQCRLTSVFSVTGDPRLAEVVQSVLTERLGKAIPLGSGGVGVSLPSDLTDDVWTHEQSYIITVAPNAINIEARTPRAAYYAAQTLAQLIEQSVTIPSLTIRDWPAISNRMVMIALDQGAFQVIDVDYWKRLIRELSAMKINAIMPYFDAGGTFKFRKHPYMGIKGDDGFTVEKAKLLSEYAHQHFIELIPQQNSLGHLGSLFKHEELKHLRDGGGTINVLLPETFTLMGELYDDLVEGFPYARSIHVGGDEFSGKHGGFGENPLVAERIKEVGTPAVYAQYLMKLSQLLKERNRGMMIWENHTGVTLEAKDMLAKDIAVFDWRYFSRKLYPSLDHILEAGFSNAWATPAVTRYYGGTNDWIRAFQNISSFAIVGADRKVPGICTCTWVHGIWGGRNIFELNLYGLAYSAQSGWNPNYKINTEEFASNYARHWFGYQNSDAADLIMQAIHMPYGKPEEQGFWHDNQGLEPICGEPLAKLAELYSDTIAIRHLDYNDVEIIKAEVTIWHMTFAFIVWQPNVFF